MTKLQEVLLSELLPFNVKQDNIEIEALSEALHQGIALACRYADGVKVMVAIDSMPEDVIDNLAVEFNIPCYHDYLDLSIKRALVKEAFDWCKRMGTPYAVRKYFSTISPNTDIQEWFEYNGEPYHFRIVATIPEDQEVSNDTFKDIAIQIERLKNARSILDEALLIKQRSDELKPETAFGTVEIRERSAECQQSSYWLSDDTLYFLSPSNDNDEVVIFCDKDGNVYTT
jgi:phage tail P2-like protein